MYLATVPTQDDWAETATTKLSSSSFESAVMSNLGVTVSVDIDSISSSATARNNEYVDDCAGDNCTPVSTAATGFMQMALAGGAAFILMIACYFAGTMRKKRSRGIGGPSAAMIAMQVSSRFNQ